MVPLAEPPHVTHEMRVVPGKVVAIEGNDLGQLTRTAELSRRHQGGQPQQLHDQYDQKFSHRSPSAPKSSHTCRLRS